MTVGAIANSPTDINHRQQLDALSACTRHLSRCLPSKDECSSGILMVRVGIFVHKEWAGIFVFHISLQYSSGSGTLLGWRRIVMVVGLQRRGAVARPVRVEAAYFTLYSYQPQCRIILQNVVNQPIHVCFLALILKYVL